MTTLRTAAQQALEAICSCGPQQREAAAALRAALAEPTYPLPDDLYPGSKDWAHGTYADRVAWLHTMYESAKRLNAALAEQPAEQEPVASPTAGMNIAQRILHVGGRNNAAGYVEFGSIQAVEALVRHVIRDLPAPQPAKAAAQEPVPSDLLDKLRKFRGLPPHNSWSNVCQGDGYFYASIESGYTAEQIAAANAILNANAEAPQSAEQQDVQVDLHSSLQAEIDRLNSIINTPQADDFLRAVSTEAEHQRQRWGSDHDAGKAPADWFWLVGYLAGKALHAAVAGDSDKARHHCISTAAALYNWHCAIKGVDVRMCPGRSDIAAVVDGAFPGEVTA